MNSKGAEMFILGDLQNFIYLSQIERYNLKNYSHTKFNEI